MAKTYTDELGEWVKKRKEKRPKQDLATVAFMAVLEDVKAAIEAGYAQKTIWALRAGVILGGFPGTPSLSC